jgi:hypothetical protein
MFNLKIYFKESKEKTLLQEVKLQNPENISYSAIFELKRLE